MDDYWTNLGALAAFVVLWRLLAVIVLNSKLTVKNRKSRVAT